MNICACVCTLFLYLTHKSLNLLCDCYYQLLFWHYAITPQDRVSLVLSAEVWEGTTMSLIYAIEEVREKSQSL